MKDLYPLFKVSYSFLLLFIFNQSYSQTLFWQQANGPYGGVVTALYIDPNGFLFAGGIKGRMFMSTDYGESWSLLGQMGDRWIRSILILQDGDILAGTNRGVWRSTDGGATWRQILLTNVWVTGLAINAEGFLFAVGCPGQVITIINETRVARAPVTSRDRLQAVPNISTFLNINSS